MKIVLVICIFFSVQTWAQLEDTSKILQPIQNYQTVPIIVKPNELELITPLNYFGVEQIEKLQPLDVGDLLQRTPGVTLKNYGDIGGLKSVSFNGLDGQHNVLIVNGAKISNPQSGLVDYSKLRTDNLTALQVATDFDYSISATVDAVLAGNAVIAQTFENSFARERFALRLSGLYGSFELADLFLAAKVRVKKKGYVAVSASRRDYDGDFKYNLNTQNIALSGVRRNNYYGQDQFNFGTGYKWETKKNKNLEFKLTSFYTQIYNQLPGAVIAYTSNNDESLSTNQLNVNAQLTIYNKKRHPIYQDQKIYANYNYDSITYLDPTYFSNPSFINHTYQNSSYTLGYLYSFRKVSKFHFQFGVEEEVNRLRSNRSELEEPLRLSSKLYVSARKEIKEFSLNAKMGYVNVLEQNQSNENWLTPRNAFLPSASIRWNKYNLITPHLSYKNSFRMPNFNELYYSQLGNLDLEPELAHQIKLGLNGKGKRKIEYKRRFYYNWIVFGSHIQNKIQTIPTVNSFIWSAQNVGNVLSYGTTLSAEYSLRIQEKVDLNFNSNLTLQNTINRNGKEDLNYNQTLAYSPNLLGNASIGATYYGIKANFEALYTGKRYSLNQNILQNELGAYWLYNATLSRKFNLVDRHVVSVFFSVKNIMNTTNHFVRYFVLPGRNFQIKIAYAFN